MPSSLKNLKEKLKFLKTKILREEKLKMIKKNWNKKQPTQKKEKNN